MKFDFDFDDESVLDITSLIDVLFLLLVFFILAATFAAPSIDVSLAKAKTAAAAAEQEKIVFSVDFSGVVYYLKEKIEKEEISHILAGKAQSTPIVFNVDKAAPFSAFIGLLDKVKELGYSKFLINAQYGDDE